MTDPAVRDLTTNERQARDLIAALSDRIVYLASERRAALWALKKELGTWKKVADATGQTVPAITKAAYKKAKEGTP
jgi:hypothetical protein